MGGCLSHFSVYSAARCVFLSVRLFVEEIEHCVWKAVADPRASGAEVVWLSCSVKGHCAETSVHCVQFFFVAFLVKKCSQCVCDLSAWMPDSIFMNLPERLGPAHLSQFVQTQVWSQQIGVLESGFTCHGKGRGPLHTYHQRILKSWVQLSTSGEQLCLQTPVSGTEGDWEV